MDVQHRQYRITEDNYLTINIIILYHLPLEGLNTRDRIKKKVKNIVMLLKFFSTVTHW